MTSGKPVVYPEMYYLHDIMWRIGSACKKTGRRAAVRQAVRRAGMPRRPRGQRRAGAAH
jgi:hypothetical protein